MELSWLSELEQLRYFSEFTFLEKYNPSCSLYDLPELSEEDMGFEDEMLSIEVNSSPLESDT